MNGCVNAVQRYFSELQKEKIVDLLWSCTVSHSAVRADTIEKQVRELARMKLVEQEIGAGKIPLSLSELLQ